VYQTLNTLFSVVLLYFSSKKMDDQARFAKLNIKNPPTNKPKKQTEAKGI
jgi:hypothetical protein